MRCDSASATHTSVAQEISAAYFVMSLRFRKAVTYTRPGPCISEEMRQFIASFGVHGAVTGDCLDQEQPILGAVVDNHVGHLAVLVNSGTQISESISVEVSPFFAGVTHINDLTARGKTGGKLLHDGAYEPAVVSGRQVQFSPFGQLERHFVQFPLARHSDV